MHLDDSLKPLKLFCIFSILNFSNIFNDIYHYTLYGSLILNLSICPLACRALSCSCMVSNSTKFLIKTFVCIFAASLDYYLYAFVEKQDINFFLILSVFNICQLDLCSNVNGRSYLFYPCKVIF